MNIIALLEVLVKGLLEIVRMAEIWVLSLRKVI